MDSKLLALVAVLALFAAGSYSVQNTQQFASDFEQFKLKHGKVYNTVEEEAYRFAVFVSNAQKIAEHNTKENTFTAAINAFTDMTSEEFASIYLTYREPKHENQHNDYTNTESVGDVNWVTAGAVTAVKNQGQCGSCWTFSTTGGLEGANFLAGNSLESYSEQYFVDCDTENGNSGCNGGWMFWAFHYAINNGWCTEASYEYKGVQGTCEASSCTKATYSISSYQNVTTGSTSALQSANDKQPVSIAVGANWSWQIYGGGILPAWECSTQLDHGVLLAGYTSSYWLVKNSWAASWGESGYIRLAPGNTCGLANSASIPNF